MSPKADRNSIQTSARDILKRTLFLLGMPIRLTINKLGSGDVYMFASTFDLLAGTLYPTVDT